MTTKITLAKGNTEIWYAKPHAFRDLILGPKFATEKLGMALPTLKTLSKTHEGLGMIDADSPEDAYVKMQAENWSPNGEACTLIEERFLSHTSMSVGDIVIQNDTMYMVDRIGFAVINDDGTIAAD